ncbi:LPS assembly lipoprotein LptE [Oleiagrimonas soli]|nr:LPS assembly lipoprotein LptE [Oleiagrimonas soli]
MDKRWLRVSLCAGLALLLSACGFHLRRGAQLPPGMEKIHLTVNGGGDLQRELARTLEIAGATLVDQSGPGVAEFRVPVARFRQTALTFTGRARVGEYEVRYQVRFDVVDSQGKTIVPLQRIELSREFTYDATQPVGTESQTEEIHNSLTSDAVQAIQFHLRAAAERAAVPATAASSATAG